MKELLEQYSALRPLVIVVKYVPFDLSILSQIIKYHVRFLLHLDRFCSNVV